MSQQEKLYLGFAVAFLLSNLSKATPPFAQDLATSPAEAQEEVLGEKGPASDPDDKYDTISRDGRRVAWREKRDNAWVVMVNGERQGGDFQKVEDLGFSPDGRRFFFKAKEGKRWLFVIDGVRGKPTTRSVI